MKFDWNRPFKRCGDLCREVDRMLRCTSSSAGISVGARSSRISLWELQRRDLKRPCVFILNKPQ